MSEVRNLEYLPREELLMRLATRLERDRGRVEVLRLLIEVVNREGKVERAAPAEFTRAVESLPRMEADILELRSILHWLTERRD